MIEIICLMLLVVTLFLMCFFIFYKGKLSKKFGGKCLFFIAVLFVGFALIFKPESFIRWDLIEHFKLIDNMRSGGLHYATTESQYADLFVYNYFAYFISTLPKNYQNLLAAIPLTIDFAIVGYIYRKMFNEHLPETNGKTRVLSILLWLFTFGIKLAITGIRCSLAVSIAVLAIYMEMIQKRNKIFSIFLYFISIFIHNFALVIIAVRLLTVVKNSIVKIVLALGISVALEPLARYVVGNVSNKYLVFSFERILDTLEEMNFISALQNFSGSTIAVYMCFIVVAVYLFVVSTKARKQYVEDEYCKNVINFASTVGAVAIGLAFNYLYLERFMYLLSFALFMVTPLHNRNKETINFGNIILIPITLFLFFFNDVYAFIVNYTGYYFFAM